MTDKLTFYLGAEAEAVWQAHLDKLREDEGRLRAMPEECPE